jgi:hypothetical protein
MGYPTGVSAFIADRVGQECRRAAPGLCQGQQRHGAQRVDNLFGHFFFFGKVFDPAPILPTPGCRWTSGRYWRQHVRLNAHPILFTTN